MHSSPIARRWLDARLLFAGLGLVVLALTLLAYWAWQASLRRHAVAIELLRSHAELAAQRLGARVQNELYLGATAIFRPVTGGRLGGVTTVPHPDALLAGAMTAKRCRCVAPLKPPFVLRTDLTSRGTVFSGRLVPSAHEQASIIQAMRDQTAQMPPGWEIAVLRGHAASNGRVVLFTHLDVPGGGVTYFGVATDSATIREFIIRPLIANTPLVTAAGASKSTHNDSLVAIRVTDALGVQLYRTQAPLDSVISSTTRFSIEWGELRVAASLRPQAANLILPGGVPHSPVPTLVALLGIATALVAGAALLVWRMHELGRLRSDFTSSVSHELRTPLTQILLYAETIEMGRQRSPEKRAEAIGVITRETRRLIHLVENVLHYSRAERSLTRVNLRAGELGEVVADTVAAFAPVAESRGSAVALRLESPVYARFDSDAIRRVVLNLLDNAVRYGPAGQTVTVSVTADGPWVRLTVEDEGPGVPAERRDEIWRPFVRLDSEDDDNITGCGIGLAIVSDLVTLHDGRRGVRTRAGNGAAFFVDLPAVAGPASLTNGQPPPQPRVQAATLGTEVE